MRDELSGRCGVARCTSFDSGYFLQSRFLTLYTVGSERILQNCYFVRIDFYSAKNDNDEQRKIFICSATKRLNGSKETQRSPQ